MENRLTPKQEKFCQVIADGKSQADAYRTAYDAKRMKAATIQNNAYKLLQRNDIATRIDTLKREIANKAIYTREEGLKMLKEIAITQSVLSQARGLGSSASAGSAVKAIAEMNRMCGYNEPEKVSIVDSEIKIKVDYGD